MFVAGIVLFCLSFLVKNLLFIYRFCVCVLFAIPYFRDVEIFQKFGSHLKILGTRWVTWWRFHIEESQILGAIVQKFVAWGSRCPRFVQACHVYSNTKSSPITVLQLRENTRTKHVWFVWNCVATPTFSDGTLQKVFKCHIPSMR